MQQVPAAEFDAKAATAPHGQTNDGHAQPRPRWLAQISRFSYASAKALGEGVLGEILSFSEVPRQHGSQRPEAFEVQAIDRVEAGGFLIGKRRRGRGDVHNAHAPYSLGSGHTP